MLQNLQFITKEPNYIVKAGPIEAASNTLIYEALYCVRPAGTLLRLISPQLIRYEIKRLLFRVTSL